MPRNAWLPIAIAAAFTLSCAHAPTHRPVTWNQIAALPVPPADHRIAYGTDSLMFGDLRLPPGAGPFPVAVVIHGGCWSADYDLAHISPLSAALTRRGIATWTLEYRRVGDGGGGWPGTFIDAARGTDHLRELARRYPLDLSRVVAIGHSAGGHLALWLPARRNLPAGSAVATADPLPLRGVVGLAGIGDLREYGRGTSFCSRQVTPLMGGGPDSLPDRYAQASPIDLLPLGVTVRLLHGTADTVVPIDQGRAFVARARANGDDARLVILEGAGHFDLIAPTASAFEDVVKSAEELTGGRQVTSIRSGGPMTEGSWETLTVHGESVRAYACGADTSPRVVLFHAWWGLNDDAVAYADRLADAGFAVLAPDLVRGRTATTIEDAERIVKEMDEDHADSVALAAVDRLTASGATKLGAVGFSMGVPWALWTATQRPAVIASVVYYGTFTGPALAKASVPVLGHFAESDPFEPEAAVRAFEQGLRDAGRNVTLHHYPGTGHWFAEPSRDAWRADAANLAFERTAAFLRERLGPGAR